MIKKVFRYFLIIVGIFFIVFFISYLYFLRAINEKNSEVADAMKFVIQKGEGSEEISRRLKEAGLIKNNFLFDVYAWQSGNDKKLKAGEYEIPKNASVKDIIRLLSSMRERMQNKITIIEGWTIQNIAQYLEENNIAKKSDFINAITRKKPFWGDFVLLKDKPEDRDLEGYLFPDTYLIYKDASIDDIIKKMLSNLDKKFTDEMRKRSSSLGFNTHEILTLASIIEKEVSQDNDRLVVSGIFHKRMKLGMGLQADSTVNYVTGRSELQPSYDDISIDNPYNTYKYRGLPPGPIGNPSLSAIVAAVSPKESEYLYFLTTPEGSVIYSKTYEEHVVAKRKYLK